MPFSTLEFVSLLPAGIAIYWLLWWPRAQRAYLIVISSFFIAFSSLFHLGIFWSVLAGTAAWVLVANMFPLARRWLLALGVAALAATLWYFKVTPPQPLGISYYSFILIGFLLDGMSGARLRPGRLIPMVAFLPVMMSGPIVRWSAWSAQFGRRRKTGIARHLTAGTQLFAIGAIKKILIADTIAVSTAPIWANPTDFTRPAVALAILAFYLQVYADFSGYTDMARGVARMMGFRLPINFKGPYLAATPLEFWSRWHISLTGWIRDYVFTPLSIAAFRRIRSPKLAPIVTFVLVVSVMTLVGLWHGVSWNFVLFGAIHGVLIALWYAAIGRGRRMSATQRLLSAILFQFVMMVSMVLFRADTVAAAQRVLDAVIHSTGGLDLTDSVPGLLLAVMLVFAAQLIEHRAGVSPLGRRLVTLRRDPRLFLVFIGVTLTMYYVKGVTLEGVWISAADPFFNQGQEKFIYFQF